MSSWIRTTCAQQVTNAIAAPLGEAVAHLRRNQGQLRGEWVRRISEHGVLTTMTTDELVAEAIPIYEGYVAALDAASPEILRAYGRDLSQRITPRGAEAHEVLGIVLLLRDVLARSLFAEYRQDFTRLDRVLDAYESAANRVTKAVAAGFVQERGNAALRESEQRYRNLVEHVLDVIYTLSRDARITSLNPVFETITGWSRNEWLGQAFAPIVHPDDLPLAMEYFRRVLQGETPPIFELRILGKSGQHRVGQFRMTPQLEDGRVIGVLGIGRDVTERKQAEGALRESEARFRQLYDEAPVSYHELDPQGRVTRVNRTELEMLGYTAEEMLGRPVWEFIVERQEESEAFAAMMAGTAPSVGTFKRTLRRKGGTTVPVLVESRVLRDKAGRIAGLRATLQDITERELAEQALHRLNDRLEEVARRIAHALHQEAAQLLVSVHIALDEVARDLPGPEGERLRKVKGLLDEVFQQLRHLSHELRPTILDNLGLQPALLFLAEGVSKRTGLRISVRGSTEGRLPPLIETALYRTIQEALTNVTTHAQATNVSVELQRDPERLRCSIRDDGIGFSFEAVARGERGLGLIEIQERLRALGGTLEIRSAPGRGTELHVTVPLET